MSALYSQYLHLSQYVTVSLHTLSRLSLMTIHQHPRSSSCTSTRNTPSSEQPLHCHIPPGLSQNPAYPTNPDTLMILHPILLIPLCKDTSLLFTFRSWQFLYPQANSKSSKCQEKLLGTGVSSLALREQ